jgi:hypothetical protein
MAKPIGQAHRKGKKTGNGSRKSAKRPVETVDENGGDSRPQFITPPPAKRSRTILTDNTNTVSTNITISGRSDGIQKLLLEIGEEFTAKVTPKVVASKLLSLIQLIFGDKEDALKEILQILEDELDLEEWNPSDDGDDSSDDGDMAKL